MSDVLLSFIGKIIGLIAVSFVAYIAPKLKEWIELKSDSEAYTVTMSAIHEFVCAADQLFKDDDPTGKIRKSYVNARLEEIGVEITEEINAFIEAEVFKL